MPGPTIKHWCPSLFEPMASGDGWLVRVKPRVGGLSADQARVVAAAAARYGSGRIEVTNRANLQIRGLSPATAPLFAQAMVEAGLASPDPATERRRNILVPADATPDAMGLAAQLEQWLESDLALAKLPAKFGFAIGDTPTADILAMVSDHPCLVGLAGGAMAAQTDHPLAAMQALTHAFLALTGEMSPPLRRMRTLVAAIGAQAVFAKAGLRPQAYDPPPPLPVRNPVGPISGAFGLGLAFGAADADMLRAAADLAERFGDGRLRTTAGRSLMLMGAPADAAALTAAACQAGFIVDPRDPRLAIAACAGKPACASAAVDVRAAATELAARWRGGGMLHISGCAKGCAHPGPAPITLVGTAPDSYAMVLNGRACDPARHAGLSLVEAAHIMAERGASPG